MKLLVLQSLPVSHHFLPLMSTFFSQHPFLKHTLCSSQCGDKVGGLNFEEDVLTPAGGRIRRLEKFP
jgi:hypothetical protein